MDLNALVAVKVINTHKSVFSPAPEDILFSKKNVTIIGEKSNVVSVYEDENVFCAVTGIVYYEESDKGAINSAQYINSYTKNKGFQPFGHYFYVQYDKTTEELLSFGDYNGGRKVYYFDNEAAIGVSSKLKILTELELVKKERNSKYEDFALVYGYFPERETIYEGVDRSLKGEHVTVNDHLACADFNTKKAIDGYHGDSLSMVKDKLYNKLLSVVDTCLADDSSTGVLLGGFDSALMASLAKKVGKQVKGYTFWYDTGIHNQKNIDNVITSTGIEHEWVKIDSEVIEAGFKKYSDYFDRPTNWPNYVIQTNYLISKIAQDSYNVCLTGDGCDEAFLGYPGIYRGARFFSRNYSQVDWLVKFTRFVTQSVYLERKTGHVYRLFRRVLSNLTVSKKLRLYFMFRIMDETTLKGLFNRDIKKTRVNISNILSAYEPKIEKYSDTIIAYEGRENIIPNRLKLTGAMDAYDIRIYSPFMHPEIRDYVRTIPEDFLRPSAEAKKDSLGKKILLDMAVEKELLPYEVVYQPKHAAVDGPLDVWYENEIRETLKDLIGSVGEIKSEKFLDDLLTEKLIERIYKKRLSVDSITGHAVSLLATYGSFWK